MTSHPVKPGKRRVRVDCMFEGKTYRGGDKVVQIPAGAEVTVKHTCNIMVLLGR